MLNYNMVEPNLILTKLYIVKIYTVPKLIILNIIFNIVKLN